MIGTKEFKKICKLSGGILKERPSLCNLANPFLFLVSGHSIFLSKYEPINSKDNILLFLVKNIFELGNNLLKLIIFIFKILFSRNINQINKNSKHRFIILSHLINLHNFKNKIDAQYGGIEKKFPKNKTIFFYLNHIKFLKKNNDSFKHKQDNFFINNDCVDIKLYGKILSDIFKELFFFYKKIKSTKSSFEKKFYIYSLKYLISLSTVKNMILFYNLEKIIKDRKIRSIITTFEGHPYEFLLFLLSKKYNLNIYAYQHSLITKSHFSMFLKLGNDLRPTKILTNGKISYEFLKKKFNSKKIILFGSEKYKKRRQVKKVNKLNCLVIPTGLESECIELLKLCSECLDKKNIKVNFILRLHPQIDKKKFVYENKKLLKNIKVSSSKLLDDDVSLCKFVLYRGSSAVVEAIQQGLTPIYFYDFKNKFQIDPLWQLKSKAVIRNSNQLILILESSKFISKNKIINYINFANKFYAPINNKYLKSIL